MPLPLLEKGPYHFDVNQSAGGVGILPDHQQALFKIKQSLKGGTGCPNPMVVKGSSDGSTAGMDNVDRWITQNNLVWTTGASRSWMVLEDANGAQLLLDCRASSSSLYGRYMYAYWSPLGGYSGGTVSSTPTTSSGQITLIANQTWLAGNSAAAIHKIHVIQSNDGKNSIVLMCFNNFTTSAWMFLEGLDPVAGWLAPVVCYVPTSVAANESTGSPTIPRMWDSETIKARTGIGGVGVQMAMGFTSEGYKSDAITAEFSVANEISGEHPFLPMGLASSTLTARGRHGRVADVFYGTSALPTGATFPDDTSRQFALFADIVVPWDGSIPEIS